MRSRPPERVRSNRGSKAAAERIARGAVASVRPLSRANAISRDHVRAGPAGDVRLQEAAAVSAPLLSRPVTLREVRRQVRVQVTFGGRLDVVDGTTTGGEDRTERREHAESQERVPHAAPAPALRPDRAVGEEQAAVGSPKETCARRAPAGVRE